MNHQKFNEWLATIVMVVALFSVVALVIVYFMEENNNPTSSELLESIKNTENASFTLGETINGSQITGLAYKNFFCVYTKERKILDVLQDCTHEYGHTNLELVDK
jgi:hypothetical protein